MHITTKTGDDGYTDSFGGQRVQKDHPMVECLGTIDELNSFLGDVKVSAGGHVVQIIGEIQEGLSLLMGVLAGMPVPAGGIGADRLDSQVKELETQLPPFTAFAVPGVNQVSAKLHIARAVSRRAERRLVGYGLDKETRAAVVPYINRLSDLLFLMAEKEAQPPAGS